MNAKDLIQLIRSQIEQVKSSGATSVTIASLETLLSVVENHLEDDGLSAAVMEHI